MTDLRIHLLGASRIEAGNALVEINRIKTIAVLAYLAVNKGMHKRESLAALLRPDYAQSRPYANLHRTLWDLNNMLGEGWIDSDRETIGLMGERDVWVDVADLWEQSMVWKKLGIVYRETGENAKAKESLFKALSLADRDSSIPEVLNVVIEIAMLVAIEGHPGKAVEILARCRDHPALAVDSNEKIEQMFGKIGIELPSPLFV